jgi:hypothetical protein
MAPRNLQNPHVNVTKTEKGRRLGSNKHISKKPCLVLPPHNSPREERRNIDSWMATVLGTAQAKQEPHKQERDTIEDDIHKNIGT